MKIATLQTGKRTQAAVKSTFAARCACASAMGKGNNTARAGVSFYYMLYFDKPR
jgi:hypothetical protein